ncbi:putative nuclease HARBI1 [Hypomesus transpacificus]|uniref:putative nuclease HARBI1 n=1 Tax=Hypomesus transpacificus TaxID=137520 RepID=UPI001F0806E9|nr:putative nuclease HARBI1 [Hypomesus transpacificus]
MLSDRAVQSNPEVQLLALLRLYAVGSFLDVVGDCIILSKASVSRGVAAVTPILLRHTRTHPNAHHTGRGPPGPQWISCHGWDPPGNRCCVWHTDPNPQSLPGGSVLDWEKTLRCHQHPGGTQVDHDGLITDIAARWPGGTHDSFVWAKSAVAEAGRGEFGRSIFLGDSGYPLRSYLVTPMINPATPQEERFNEAHTHTRTHIKRVFGRWKCRFRCIHRSSGGLRLSPVKCCRVIVVTAMLHNKAVRIGADERPSEDEDGESSEDEAPNLAPLRIQTSTPPSWCPDQRGACQSL